MSSTKTSVLFAVKTTLLRTSLKAANKTDLLVANCNNIFEALCLISDGSSEDGLTDAEVVNYSTVLFRSCRACECSEGHLTVRSNELDMATSIEIIKVRLI